MIGYAWLSRDLNLKLFSLAVATGLFVFVSVENVTPIDVEFNLEYRIADDMIFTNDPPATLRATLKGPWAAVRSYDHSTLETVVIDLSHAPLGPQRIMIDPASVHPPGGMRVYAVQPSSLEVVLDRRVERKMPVRADLLEKPPFGYSIASVRLVPEKVRVQGPASRIQNIDFVSTRSIDVANLTKDFNLDIELRPLPPPTRLLDKRVTVYVDIAEEWIERTFQNIPVVLENAPPQSRLSPTTVDITLKGPRRFMDKVNKAALEAYVDVGLEAQQSGRSLEKTIRMRHEFPDQVQWIGSVPKVRIFLVPVKKNRRSLPNR